MEFKPSSTRFDTPPSIAKTVVIFESQVTNGEISVPFTLIASVDPYGPCIRGAYSMLLYQQSPTARSVSIKPKEL